MATESQAEGDWVRIRLGGTAVPGDRQEHNQLDILAVPGTACPGRLPGHRWRSARKIVHRTPAAVVREPMIVAVASSGSLRSGRSART